MHCHAERWLNEMFPRDKARPDLNEPRTKLRRPKPTEHGIARKRCPSGPEMGMLSKWQRGRKPRHELPRRGGVFLSTQEHEAVATVGVAAPLFSLSYKGAGNPATTKAGVAGFSYGRPSRNSQSVSAAVIFSGHAAREGALAMPRNYVIFGDIEGKLDVLLSSVSSCGLSAELLPNGNQPPVDVTT